MKTSQFKKGRGLTDITEIEEILLPLTLTSQVRNIRQIIYIAIRKYNDLSVPNNSDTLKSTCTRYYHRQEIMTYLNMIKTNTYHKEDEDDESEETIDKEAKEVTKDSLISELLKLKKDAKGNNNTQIKIAQVIAQVKGFTRTQKAKEQTKVIYVPMTCVECPLYKEAMDAINNKNNNKKSEQ